MLSLPPFNTKCSAACGLGGEDFSILLTYLERCGIIQKTEEGNLLLGLEGERIVNRHSFYPIFPGDDEYRVLEEGREIGRVNFVPSPGSVIAVGGISRLVKSIDGLRREIWVSETAAEGGGKLWRGVRGSIHSRVSGGVKNILAGERVPPYLSPQARTVLERGRRKARALDLLAKPLLPLEGGFLIVPWLGSAGLRTLETLLKKPAVRKNLRISFLGWESDFSLLAETNVPGAEFAAGLAEACRKTLQAEPGAENPSLIPDPIPYTDKYDHLLPPALLEKQYAANMLDPGAPEDLLRQLGGLIGNT
jgi:ATP-dependent Lhr-like helicase